MEHSKLILLIVVVNRLSIKKNPLHQLTLQALSIRTRVQRPDVGHPNVSTFCAVKSTTGESPSQSGTF